MSISGYVNAKCKVCGSISNAHIDNFPFVDSEIIGTCHNCFERKSHNIYDENVVEDFESNMPVTVGRIVFNEAGYYFEVNGNVVKKSQIARLMYWNTKPFSLKKKRSRKEVIE